nr:MAG TPA: hypothetical protein [Caudoviricetes sp.]
MQIKNFKVQIQKDGTVWSTHNGSWKSSAIPWQSVSSRNSFVYSGANATRTYRRNFSSTIRCASSDRSR